MTLSRRTTLGMLALAPLLLRQRSALAAGIFSGRTLVYASWGGEYQIIQRLAYCDPFERKTGALVLNDGPISSQLARVLLQTGQCKWDVISAGQAMMMEFGDAGWLARMDGGEVDLSRVLPQYRYRHGVGVEIGADVLVYSTASYPGVRPGSWADLFAMSKFPGKRMIYDSPYAALEIALLGDGVPIDRLYPLDVERAFRKLETIKEHIVFYKTYSQSQQLIFEGRVSCGHAIASRMFRAAAAGAKLGVNWSENLRHVTPAVIPRTTGELDMAYAFVNEMLVPENIAVMANRYAVSPTAPIATKLIDPDVRPWLAISESNLRSGIDVNADYWSANLVSLTAKWNAWRGEITN